MYHDNLMDMQKEITIIENSNSEQFTKDVNALLKQGWQILSSNIGFVQSERYDFCSNYQAIMVYQEA